MAGRRDSLRRCLAALREHGLLLAVDAKLPSVTTLVAGEPVRGSWWSHPAAQEIYDAKQELARRPGILTLPLVCGKGTYVDRQLDRDAYDALAYRDPWQMRGLPAHESRLLDVVDQRGLVRVDDAAKELGGAEVRTLGRELASRMLVLGGQVHTETGRHVRTLKSWSRWFAETEGGVPFDRGDADAARARIDAAARSLGPTATLPWWPAARRKSR